MEIDLVIVIFFGVIRTLIINCLTNKAKAIY